MRRAKIVCTLGPASRSPAVLRELIAAGMNVCRLNFSHGVHDEHRRTVELVRREARRSGAVVAILQDLQGPRIRTGPVREGTMLVEGRTITLTTRSVQGDAQRVSTSFSKLPAEVSPGDAILLSDGLIHLEVTAVRDAEVVCRVVHGGPLQSNKGMNIPGRKLSIAALTTKDKEDLKLGIELGVDWIAQSFVRSAADLRLLRNTMKRLNGSIPVVAKLEKPQAIEHLDEILDEADAVMVARGDLAVETSPEQVPILQKRVIREARRRGVPVITATQMLESMVEHPQPTRAEASDVANAVFDGTDAVMLSAETAVGHFPVEAVRLMGRIVTSAESELALTPREDVGADWQRSVSDAICRGAARAAEGLKAPVIAVFTQSGSTARRITRHRPDCRILAFTPDPVVLRRVMLYWGIEPRLMPSRNTTDAMIAWVAEALEEEGVVRKGERIVVTAGTPVGRTGSTNFLKVHTV